MTRYHVTIEGSTYSVTVADGRAESLDGDALTATLGGDPRSRLRTLRLGPTVRTVLAELERAEHWTVSVDGNRIGVHVVDERTHLIRSMSGSAESGPRSAHVQAPMPGLVIRIRVSPGDVVTRGQGIAIVEAMKMENELTAQADGRVTAILVEPGDTVERGQILVELDASASDSEAAP